MTTSCGNMWRPESNCGSSLPFSPMWVQGMELRLSNLAKKTPKLLKYMLIPYLNFKSIKQYLELYVPIYNSN